MMKRIVFVFVCLSLLFVGCAPKQELPVNHVSNTYTLHTIDTLNSLSILYMDFKVEWPCRQDSVLEAIRKDIMAQIFGVDAVRYFVLHEMPFETDGVISWDLLVERFNSDLANTLGNLVKRTISMSNQYFGGTVEDKGAREAVDDKAFELLVKGVRGTHGKGFIHQSGNRKASFFLQC